MLSKEMYEKLNKKISVNKELIPDYTEIIQYYKEMLDISNNPEIIEDTDEDILNVAELYSMYYGIMSLAISSKVEDENYKEKALYASIFSTIANSITSVIYLTKKGLDYQANVIMRQLFELCMILLNIGIDKDKANILMNTEMTEENMKIWRKYFSPKALNETIEKYEGIDFTDWRKRQYSNYSNYTHNEFLTFWIFSYSKPKDEEEKLMPNIWGHYVSRVNNILNNMIGFIWYTSKAFMKIIVDKNTHIFKENIGTEKDLWNFAGYLFLILDEYYMFVFEKKI